MVVSAKKTKDAWHTSVLFTGTVKSPNSAFRISETTKPISTQFLLHILNMKEIASAFLEIFVPKNFSIFFTFFFAQNYKYILSRIKTTFSYFDFF